MTLERPAPADIVIDTSAVMAVLLEEPAGDRVAHALLDAAGPIMSAATLAELFLVASGAFERGADDARSLVAALGCSIIPVDAHTADEAHRAWRTFGKGNHPARLNYGDCFTYALAKHWELPLLCVGGNFAQTDLELVPLGA